MFNFFIKKGDEASKETTDEQKDSILASNQFIESFKNDYISDKSIIERFPVGLDERIENYLFEYHQACLKDGDYSLLITCLKNLYLNLWVVENGYAEVLAKKSAELCYYDEYGDLRIEKYTKEVDLFVSRKCRDIIVFLEANIPEKYLVYARNNNLYTFIISDLKLNYMTPEVDFSTEIISSFAVDFYCTELDSGQHNQLPEKLEAITNDIVDALVEVFNALSWEQLPSQNLSVDTIVLEKLGVAIMVKVILPTFSITKEDVDELTKAEALLVTNLRVIITSEDINDVIYDYANEKSVALVQSSNVEVIDQTLFE
jgi:hypothetical protein